MSDSLATLEDCKNASIHNIGSVQANGALVAVHSESQLIEYCSANSLEFLGVPPAKLLGQTGVQWMAHQWPACSSLATQEGNLDWRDLGGSDGMTVVGHKRGAHRIFEFERAQPSAAHWWNHATRTRFLERLTATRTAEQCREFLVEWVFELSGYDRVMMYKFLPDWHGEVVHERCRPRIEGFLGLRFPALDIPPNARQLFALNWQRAIVDVDEAAVPILPWNEDSQPLDLTYSILRSPHPVHVQYLKNMGVQATLTLSTVVNGKLWGLIACHHLSPHALHIRDRFAFEEMARMVSMHMTNLLRLIEQNHQADMRERLSCFQGAISNAGDNARLALSQNLGLIKRTFAAGGVWLRFEGEDFFSGLVPDKLALAPLRDFLEKFSRDKVSHFSTLPEALQHLRAVVANASGLVFIPLGSADFIALLRPEVIETVNWAGKPASSDESASAGPALTPRNSFALWAQHVRNSSEQWTGIEIEFAEQLRRDLLQFIGNVRLEKIALHDPLTGLANRFLFERRLQQEVRDSMTRDSAFAVHMIDLDKFKQVNDTLGHAAGDELLRQVGARLKKLVRNEDTVARLGGDEFAILQTGLKDRAAASATAARVVQSLSAAYEISGKPVEIGASVGVSSCPSDTVAEDELLECADLALYQVKRSGRNAFSMYAPAMRTAELRSTDGEILTRALRDDEFRICYQPIIDARTSQLRGLEAFLRWQIPGGNELTASEFMPVAEQKRLTPVLHEWTLDAVFRQYQLWLREGLPLVPVTVNIGTAEFATQDLLGQIEKLAARYETGWHWLRLDIKEQSLLADVGYAIRKLGSLLDAGVSANLDNFGRGFVPLGYLSQLPFRGIKVDGILFEKRTDRQYFNAVFQIVQSIAQVSSAQLTVTKVETQEMKGILADHRIDLIQGFAIGRPAGAEKAKEWLREPEKIQP